MKNTKFYNQRNHSVVVAASDGSWRRSLSDFDEGDDVISVEPLGDRVALSQGFDKSVISFSSVDGGTVTVKLKPTSRDIGLLNDLYNKQKTTPTLLDVYISTGVDEVVSLLGCGITTEGLQTGGPKQQGRVYSFIGGQLNLDENQG